MYLVEGMMSELRLYYPATAAIADISFLPFVYREVTTAGLGVN